MASAARVHIAERGRDPRRYVLLATGGAGPVLPGISPRGSVSTASPPGPASPPPSGSCWRRTGWRRWPNLLPGSTGTGSKRRTGGSRKSAGRCWRTPDSLPKPPHRPFRRPAVPRPGLRDRRRAARGTVHAGFRGSHRGCVPGGLRAGFLPGAARNRDRGGGNVRVAARAGGEGRRTETTGADIRAARGERDARKGTRLAYFPEYRGRCGCRSSIATCFAPETAFRVRQSSKCASRPPARDPGPNTTRRNGIRRRRFRRRRL